MANKLELTGTCTPEAAAKFGGTLCDGYVEVPIEYAQQFANNPDFITVISEMTRPGVRLFLTKIEHTLFPPDKPEMNGLFQLGTYQWEAACETPFIVLITPAIAFEYLEMLAPGCDIRLARGTLQVMSDGITATFPVHGSQVFRLENLPGSAVYLNAVDNSGGFSGYRKRINELRDQENEQIQKFLQSVKSLQGE